MDGRRVLHYRIEEKIGAGGMGVVYKARDTKLQRTVALKFLPPGLGCDEENRQRFLREATAASTLDHPNICTIYEINETEDGQLFLAMAYYEGKTLRDQISAGPIAAPQALQIAIQLGRALECAHRHGVVHRDIKPANLMLVDGVLKVLDFGLAKIADECVLTRAGQTVGTAYYMSPEQARGEDVDHRTDIWSAGIVLHEMLAGQPPFQGNTYNAIVEAILHSSPQPVSRLRTGVPAQFDWIIAKASHKYAAERYQSAGELVRDLEALSGGGEPVTAKAAPATPTNAVPAIAVLPFDNRSPEKENEYFSDGLTEDLINGLAQLEGLRVVSRTSAFEFKGKAQNVQKTGAALHVGYVLEGSVRKAGNRVRIAAQLSEVANGFQVWSQRYDRELSDVFEVQDEITRHIVTALKIRFSASAYEGAGSPHSGDVEAYQLYLKGRFYWNRKTPASLQRAREYFDRALALDPDYALAHSGLADYYTLIASYWMAPADAAWPNARAEALKALERNTRLADPYVSLGCVRMFYEWDWPGAEKAYRTAIELRPQFAEAHLRYCYYLMATGQLQEALQESGKAVELDPLSAAANSADAMVLAYLGEYDRAIERCRTALEIEPGFIELYYSLGIACQYKGLIEEAIAAFEQGTAVSGNMGLMLGWLGACYVAAGRRADALRLLEQLLDQSRRSYAVPLPIAILYCALGEIDLAFEWLNKAADAHDSLLCYLRVVPTYAPLRGDPRYASLLRRMGLARDIAENTMTLPRTSAGAR